MADGAVSGPLVVCLKIIEIVDSFTDSLILHFYSYFLIDTLKNWWMCEVVNLCQTVAYAAKEDLLVNFVQSS